MKTRVALASRSATTGWTRRSGLFENPQFNTYQTRKSVQTTGATAEAFKTLKGDLAIRPIFHQQQPRIEAHIFIAFLAYCLHVTLGRRLHALASGLTPRSVIDKFAAVQMIDLHVPTTDGRELLLTRYTEPEPELALLLDKLKFVLPAQPEPKISAAQIVPSSPV
jgi:hypothetical protein